MVLLHFYIYHSRRGLADRIGVKLLVITAALACIVSTIMIHSFQTTANWLYIIPSLIILGLGYGFYQSPNNKMLLSVIPLTFKTQISATMTLTKNLGSVLGNAFAGLIIATAVAQSSLSGRVGLSASQAASFLVGFQRIFLFGAILGVLLLLSALDLEKYAGKYLSKYFTDLKEYEVESEPGKISEKPLTMVMEE